MKMITWQGILAAIGTVLLLVYLVSFLFDKNEDYFEPQKVQVSDCSLDGENFVEVLCKENSIDPNGFYRIECPKCPSGNGQNDCNYNEVKFGAYVERDSNGIEMCIFYGVPEGVEDIPAGTYCGQCGYQIGHDWKIINLTEADK